MHNSPTSITDYERALDWLIAEEFGTDSEKEAEKEPQSAALSAKTLTQGLTAGQDLQQDSDATRSK